MFKIWGRNNGSNVIKVLWCLGEIGVEFERIDWGGPFGGNDDPEYRAKNPNGRLPTLEEEDGFTLWESGAVIRYLCAKYSMGKFYPEDLRERAASDKWMDWSSLNMASFNLTFLEQFQRASKEEHDKSKVTEAVKKAAPFYDILDAHLANNDFIGGKSITMADFPAGSLTHRWMAWNSDRPSNPNVEAYYERLCQRPEYQKHVIEPNAPTTERALAM